MLFSQEKQAQEKREKRKEERGKRKEEKEMGKEEREKWKRSKKKIDIYLSCIGTLKDRDWAQETDSSKPWSSCCHSVFERTVLQPVYIMFSLLYTFSLKLSSLLHFLLYTLLSPIPFHSSSPLPSSPSIPSAAWMFGNSLDTSGWAGEGPLLYLSQGPPVESSCYFGSPFHFLLEPHPQGSETSLYVSWSFVYFLSFLVGERAYHLKSISKGERESGRRHPITNHLGSGTLWG